MHLSIVDIDYYVYHFNVAAGKGGANFNHFT